MVPGILGKVRIGFEAENLCLLRVDRIDVAFVPVTCHVVHEIAPKGCRIAGGSHDCH